MLKNFGLLAISCFMCLSNAEAQVFHVQRTGESVKTTVAEPIKTQTETVAREETAEQEKEAKVVRPTEATPEQIIAAQAPLMKKLKYASQKYEPSELRGIVDALNRYSEVQVRRENLSLPSDQQIEFKKTTLTYTMQKPLKNISMKNSCRRLMMIRKRKLRTELLENNKFRTL
ncbi:MAG: hypothetical protein ACLU99_06600 [Alphaproteobacteria bacterium]